MDSPFRWICLMCLFLHSSGQSIAAINQNSVQGTFPNTSGLSMPIRHINSPAQKGGGNGARIPDPRLAALMGTEFRGPGMKTNRGNSLSRMPSTQVTMAPGIQRSSLGSPYPNTAYSTSPFQSTASHYAVHTTPFPRSRTLPPKNPVVSNEFVPPAPKKTAIQFQKEQSRSAIQPQKEQLRSAIQPQKEQLSSAIQLQKEQLRSAIQPRKEQLRSAIQPRKEQLRSMANSSPYKHVQNSRQNVKPFAYQQNTHTPQQIPPGGKRQEQTYNKPNSAATMQQKFAYQQNAHTLQQVPPVRKGQEQTYNKPNNAATMQQKSSQPIQIQTSGAIQKSPFRKQHPSPNLRGQTLPSSVLPNKPTTPKHVSSKYQYSNTPSSVLQTTPPFHKDASSPSLPKMGRTHLGALQVPAISQKVAQKRIHPGQISSSIVSKIPPFHKPRMSNRNEHTEKSPTYIIRQIPEVVQNVFPRKREHIQISSINILRNLPVDHQMVPGRVNDKQTFPSYTIQNPQVPQQIAPQRTTPVQTSSTSFQNQPVQQQWIQTEMKNTQTSLNPPQDLHFTNTVIDKKRDFAEVTSTTPVMQTQPIPQQSSHSNPSYNSWSNSNSQNFPVYKNVAARRMEPRQIDPSSLSNAFNSPNPTQSAPENMKPTQPLPSKFIQIQPIQQRIEPRRNNPVYQQVPPRNKKNLQISTSNIVRRLPIEHQFIPRKPKPGNTSYKTLQYPRVPQQLGSEGMKSKKFPPPNTLQTKPVQIMPVPIHSGQTDPPQTVPVPIQSEQTPQTLLRKSITAKSQKQTPLVYNQQTGLPADGNVQSTRAEQQKGTKSKKMVDRIPTIINGKKYMIDPLFVDIVKRYISKAGLKMTIGLSKNVMQTLPDNKPSMIRQKVPILDTKADTKTNSGVNSNQGILDKINNFSRRGEVKTPPPSTRHLQKDTTNPYIPQPNTGRATNTFISQPTSTPSTTKIGIIRQPQNWIPQTTVTPFTTPSTKPPLLPTTTAPKRRKALLLPFRKSPVKPTTAKPVTKSTLRPTLPSQIPPAQKTTKLPNIVFNTPTNKIKGLLSNTLQPTSSPRTLFSRKTTGLALDKGVTPVPSLTKPTLRSSSGSLVGTMPIIDSPPKSETQLSNPVSTGNSADNIANPATNTRPSVSNAILPGPYVKSESNQLLSIPDKQKPKAKKQPNKDKKTFTQKKPPVKVQLGFHLNHFGRKKSKQEKSDSPIDSDGFILRDIYRQNDGLTHSNTVGVHRGFVGFNNGGNNVELLVLR